MLWLYAPFAVVRQNLSTEAEKLGIDPSRLLWADRVPHAEHLARQSLGDLFLDTFPYTAHTTASDALRAGLPVLTRSGETFASRVAASLLTNLGFPELITTSAAKFEEAAIALAHDPIKLAEIRKRLSEAVQSAPLYDSAIFTKHFEAALIRALREHDCV